MLGAGLANGEFRSALGIGVAPGASTARPRRGWASPWPDHAAQAGVLDGPEAVRQWVGRAASAVRCPLSAVRRRSGAGDAMTGDDGVHLSEDQSNDAARPGTSAYARS